MDIDSSEGVRTSNNTPVIKVTAVLISAEGLHL